MAEAPFFKNERIAMQLGMIRQIMQILSLLTIFSWSGIGLADPNTDIDITAFGDSAFIAGNKLIGNDNNHLIVRHLKKLEPIRSNDINLVNLEATLAATCKKMADKQFSFVMTPEALSEYLKWGMNFIGLANNHSVDCVDPYPFGNVESILKKLMKQFPDSRFHGIARSSSNLVKYPASRTIRGVSVGMVSIKGWDNGSWTPLGNIANRLRIFKKLQLLPHDVRILSLHGGVESTRQPGLIVAEIAREFVNDYDGDIVFAHHPHMMQGVEVIKKKNGRTGIIFFSLGNGLHNGLSVKGDGLAAKVFVGKNGVNKDRIQLFPLKYASFNPMPYKIGELPAALAEVELSIKLIPPVLRKHSGYVRQPVRLIPTSEPAVGARVEIIP